MRGARIDRPPGRAAARRAGRPRAELRLRPRSRADRPCGVDLPGQPDRGARALPLAEDKLVAAAAAVRVAARAERNTRATLLRSCAPSASSRSSSASARTVERRRGRGGLLLDLPLVAVDRDRERIVPAQLELAARLETGVVVPVQQVAVVLGEADDRGAGAGLQLGEGASSLFSRCSKSGSTGQPCGQRSGCPSFSAIRSTMSSVNVSPSSSA